MAVTGPYKLSDTQKFGRGPCTTGGVAVMPTASQAGFRTAAAAETTVVSSAAADASAGTGMRTLIVEGVAGDGLMYRETVTLNGTTPVTLEKQFRFVYRMWGTSAGSGEVNAGDIDAKHGATVICRMSAGEGQTLHAAMTIPANQAAEIDRLYGEIESVATARVTFRLITFQNGVQRVRYVWSVDGSSQITGQHTFDVPIEIPVDGCNCVWIEATSSSGTPTVNAGFDIHPVG